MSRLPRIVLRADGVWSAAIARWWIVASACVGLLAALSGAPSIARAAADPALSWEAPPGCPDASQVRAALERLLAETPPERRRDLELSAQAVVVKRPEGPWSLRLAISTRDGESARELDAESCDALAEATALLVAMTVDPTAGSKRPEEQVQKDTSEEEPAPGVGATPARVPEAPPEAAVTTPSKPVDGPVERELEAKGPPKLQAALGWDLILGTGGPPSFGLGLGLGLELIGPRFRVGVRGHHLFTRTVSLEDRGLLGARVDVQLWAGQVRGCGVPRVRAGYGFIEFPLCGGVELGGLRGEGVGLPISSSYTGLWAAILASPGLMIHVGGSFAFTTRVDVGIALSRPRFAVENLGDVYRAPPASFAFILGFELRMPPERRRPSRGGATR
ncbi:MAG: hypothetical protein KC636_22670 [Myxococcales bacterium]|nr:hypothetical protein [Myxococcales bacterium]